MNSLKIADFGLSATLGEAGPVRSLADKVGTQLFMAPEQVRDQDYGKYVDIWSVGIIMYSKVTLSRVTLYCVSYPNLR